MEKVIRHGAFSGITVLICLRACLFFFQADIIGLGREEKPLVEQKHMPGCPLYTKLSILFTGASGRALGFSSRVIHPPRVTISAPSCNLQEFIVSKILNQGLRGTLGRSPVALSWSGSLPSMAVPTNKHHGWTRVCLAWYSSVSERCKCVSSVSVRMGRTGH